MATNLATDKPGQPNEWLALLNKKLVGAFSYYTHTVQFLDIRLSLLISKDIKDSTEKSTSV